MEFKEDLSKTLYTLSETKNLKSAFVTSDVDFIDVHPNNNEVAIVYSNKAFLLAAQNSVYKAVIHKGFEHEAYDACIAKLSEIDKNNFLTPLQILGEDKFRQMLEAKFSSGIADTFCRLRTLFFQATYEKDISFKLQHTASTKPHHHFTSNMTFPIGEYGGTCFDGGQVDPSTPFFIKPGFMHWTPKDNNKYRQVAIFANDFKLPF